MAHSITSLLIITHYTIITDTHVEHTVAVGLGQHPQCQAVREAAGMGWHLVTKVRHKLMVVGVAACVVCGMATTVPPSAP